MSEPPSDSPAAFIQRVRFPHPVFENLDFEPVNTWNETKRALGLSTGIGLLTVATLNAVRREKVGALGIISRSGSTLLYLVLGASSYKFAQSAISNLRQKRDTTNEFYAGTISGALVGSLATKSLVYTTGISLGLGVISAIVFWSGGLIGRYKQSSYVHRGVEEENNFTPRKSDDVRKQGFWDVARRRPLSQTLEEVGDGGFKP